MRLKLVHIFTTILVFISVCGLAQNDSTLSNVQLEQYTEQSKQLVSYLEGTLNFLGNANELPSEKDIIYNESYLKMFVDDEVQVEDDLDENREIPLNKDVQAYLKDIDFFFKDVSFRFEIEKVEHLVTDSNIVVFKLTLNRHLEGITVGNDSVKNNQLRYIELNLDPLQKDLKIASIYTTKIREKEELRNWWNTMSSDWKNYFGKSVIVYDTLPLNNITWFSDSSIITMKWVDEVSIDTAVIVDDGITDPPLWAVDTIQIIYDTITRVIPDTINVPTSTIYRLLKTFRKAPKVDLSNNLTISNLEPLSELTDLIELDISNTLIEDLNPIRNLKKLEVFNLSGSAVSTLASLRYINSLTEINLSNTLVDNIDVMANLSSLSRINISYSKVINLLPLENAVNLSRLEASGTRISDLSPLNNLPRLSDLNISNSAINSLNTIDSLIAIQNLNIDSTQISSLEPLSESINLSVIQANNTQISNLQPLNNHDKLKVIYCDNSNVNMSEANKFMDENQHCLVIYNSQELLNWWEDLSLEWKSIFQKNYNISSPITKEKLHQLINQTKLSVAYNNSVESIEPVMMLHRLEEIELQNTSISDLTPLSGLNNLEEINLSNTEVTDLSPLSSLQGIKTISFENTSISDITPLQKSVNIEFVYCDKTGISNLNATEFNIDNTDCLVVYQSEKLRMWWNALNGDWQAEFQKATGIPAVPTKEELHRLVNLSSLQIVDNMSISNLNPLHLFARLEELTVNRTSVSDISPILSLVNLKKLDISKNPISVVESISKLNKLEELIIRNTSVADLEPISYLSSLTILDIAGTKIKSLKYIDKMPTIEKLYINNTRVKNIKQLYSLTKLDFLQCYNTSIKSSKIDEFKRLNLDVEVVYY